MGFKTRLSRDPSREDDSRARKVSPKLRRRLSYPCRERPPQKKNNTRGKRAPCSPLLQDGLSASPRGAAGGRQAPPHGAGGQHRWLSACQPHPGRPPPCSEASRARSRSPGPRLRAERGRRRPALAPGAAGGHARCPRNMAAA